MEDEDGKIVKRLMTTETSEQLRLAIDFTYWGEIIDKVPDGKGNVSNSNYSLGQEMYDYLT
jgi:hypothetical protein